MRINAVNENITVISVMLIPAKQLNLLQEVQVTLVFWNSFEVLYHKLNFCTFSIFRLYFHNRCFQELSPIIATQLFVYPQTILKKILW